MIQGFTVLCAVLPSLLLLWYFYKKDLNPEPAKGLWITFVLGVLITVPAGFVGSLADELRPFRAGPIFSGLFSAFLAAAVPEEILKYRVITRYSAKLKAFNEPMDGVVYGAAASLGFAALENFLYVAQGGWAVAIGRALTAVPSHACLGAIMGYYVGQARFNPQSARPAEHGLLSAIILHGLYDFPLLAIHHARQQAGKTDTAGVFFLPEGWLLLLFIAVLVFEFVWTARLVRRLRREQMQLSRTAKVLR